MKLNFHLLSAAAFAPLASAKEYETVFTFKKDFYLKFEGLSVGMSPHQGDALIAGLDDNVEAFKTTWTNKITDLGCDLAGDFPTPEFSYCDWKYPERYDITRLPLAGECHEADDSYIQRLFYKIKDLKVSCNQRLDIKDLGLPKLMEESLDLMISSALAVTTVAPGVDDPWAEANGVDVVDDNDDCNALLSINRYTKIDVSLKCLTDTIDVSKADVLKEALDEYFEESVVPKIIETVENVSSPSAVYSVKSPYEKDSDTMYCYYAAYYNDGKLVDQYETDDGTIVTNFVCGFDLVWFKDKGFDDSLLGDLVATVQKVFTDDDPSFLTFLQEKNKDVAWIQNTVECGVVDPNILSPPAANTTTASPTAEPTKSPTEAPTTSPTQRPTATPSESPTANPSEYPTIRPSTSSGPSAPTDTSSPTQNPTTAAPTSSPTSSPTRNPTSSPTDSPSRNPTKAPTVSPVVATLVTPSPVPDDCITNTNVTEEQSPYVTDGSGTCGNGEIGDGICPQSGNCCSQWGWCGTTDAYCNSTAPSPFPIDPNLGKCGSGDGVIGDGTCSGENECCSAWGYCGTGDQYCSITIDTKTGESSEGKCGGGGVDEGECLNESLCCSVHGFCGSGSAYCNGFIPRGDSGGTDTAGSGSSEGGLPDIFKATQGYRCGRDETDARSNCKKECTHAKGDNNGKGPCEDDEECWGVDYNYCNTFDEGTHPVCEDLERANDVNRCGLNEMSARGHCGKTCNSDAECPSNELCFSVRENLCDCHLENLRNSVGNMPEPDVKDPEDVEEAFFENTTTTSSTPVWNQEDPTPTNFPTEPSPSSDPFKVAKQKIAPFFGAVKSVGEGSVEGRDNASFQVNMSVAVVAIVTLNVLFSYFM